MGSYSGQRRQTSCVTGWIKFALLGVIISVFFQGALGEVEPTESQCRPYIEKALKEQHLEIDEKDIEGNINEVLIDEQEELPPTDELTDSTEGSVTKEDEGNDDDDDDDNAELKRKDEGFQRSFANAKENAKIEEDDTDEDDMKTKEQNDDLEEENAETNGLEIEDTEDEVKEENADTAEEQDDADKTEEDVDSDDKIDTDDKNENAKSEDEEKETEIASDDDKDVSFDNPIDIEVREVEIDNDDNDKEETDDEDNGENADTPDAQEKKLLEDEDDKQASEDKADGDENETKEEKEEEQLEGADEDDEEDHHKESILEKQDEDDDEEKENEKEEEEKEKEDEREKDEKEKEEEREIVNEERKDEKEEDEKEKENEDDAEKEDTDKKDYNDDKVKKKMERTDIGKIKAEGTAENEAEEDTDQEAPEEEELIKEMVIPENLRPRDHIEKILKLEESGLETILEKTIDTTLKALKGLYDSAIKPLEMLYKYRDLSNRHFGDPEIFSKPLILFMGPWSGGKSSTINYLLDNEFSHTSLRTGAEPSPAYFNILMHGEKEEILDGTQLAADWTFSGLQKFGQSLLDRLKGIKLPNKLLEKVNIVEIPGILEIRKQVQRLFPFNDACQWFIDRADIIFLVYDPSKLDVGPETEAILDQLKGREYQTRIILNKADQVKPEELMRVQGTLIWNISPLMSSSEPPIMYSTSLWSLPYEVGAPTRLLQAQERAFLRDLREAIDKRVENKIASARRFAVRVRNHAKMVDCYLTTYYNHKTIFGNRKKISDDIIEYPQKYHIYEGLSTLTNISRYDLPDPDVYRDFFKINPLYEFKKLSETCTYFRGCPINKLDVAIAYDLPELVGKYRKAVETAKEQLQKENS